jgi:O-6-methylguanine DNA methyltransferase
MQWHCIATAEGAFRARYTSSGLAELRFPESAPPIFCDAPEPANPWHALANAAVFAILRGEIPRELPPLDLTGHTAFRIRVWEELQEIPLGQTASYSEIAVRLGDPNATRAVGGACGANPIPLIIPCHRVLAAGRKLGGFSGGLHWKRKLLAIEGIHIGTTPEQLGFAAKAF